MIARDHKSRDDPLLQKYAILTPSLCEITSPVLGGELIKKFMSIFGGNSTITDTVVNEGTTIGQEQITNGRSEIVGELGFVINRSRPVVTVAIIRIEHQVTTDVGCKQREGPVNMIQGHVRTTNDPIDKIFVGHLDNAVCILHERVMRDIHCT